MRPAGLPSKWLNQRLNGGVASPSPPADHFRRVRPIGRGDGFEGAAGGARSFSKLKRVVPGPAGGDAGFDFGATGTGLFHARRIGRVEKVCHGVFHPGGKAWSFSTSFRKPITTWFIVILNRSEGLGDAWLKGLTGFDRVWIRTADGRRWTQM